MPWHASEDRPIPAYSGSRGAQGVRGGSADEPGGLHRVRGDREPVGVLKRQLRISLVGATMATRSTTNPVRWGGMVGDLVARCWGRLPSGCRVRPNLGHLHRLSLESPDRRSGASHRPLPGTSVTVTGPITHLRGYVRQHGADFGR